MSGYLHSITMLPQKKYFRQRAHSNPIADHIFDYPVCPEQMDWESLYPLVGQDNGSSSGDNRKVTSSRPPHFVDIGCGYGGLLVELSPRYPEKRILGIEIRVKVSDYVKERIKALRIQGEREMEEQNEGEGGDNSPPTLHHPYYNIACIRGNAMKYLPNFFPKGSIEKMFFLFPDPHFKKTKFKWRIISPQLLAEYAYVMMIGGRVYVATDVKQLYDWMVEHFTNHPLFAALGAEEQETDPIVPLLFDSTEEGKKVTRMEGDKYIAVFVRISDPFYANKREEIAT